MSIHDENNKQDVSIGRLEVKMDTITDRVDKIENNHLPHIYNRLGSIETKMAAYAGGITVAVSMANILIKKFL